MARLSTIDRLPKEIREEIARLRREGCSISEIMEALKALGIRHVSRSTMGRYTQKVDRMAAKVQETRAVAETLVRRLGDAGVSQTVRANIELMHGVILDLHMAQDHGEEGDTDKSGLAALKGNPKGIELLSKAIEHLTKASKTDADFVKEIREQERAELKREAEANLKDEGKRQGLSVDAVAALAAGLFRVKKK